MLLGGVAFLAGAVALAAYWGHVFRGLELTTVDARFSNRGAQAPPRDVVVVKIDDVTFGQLGVRWPFPRSLHAKVVDALKRDGAKVIVYDVQFTEPTVPAQDNALIDAVARAGNVVLATSEVDKHGHTAIFGGDSVLSQIHAKPGDANFPPDSGNVIRRVAYAPEGLKSLSVVAAEQVLGHPLPRFRTRWIDFAGDAGRVRSVSFSHVVKGQVDPSVFRGKVVVVGPTAPSLQDVHATSTSSVMPGAEVQANAIETALRGFPLRGAPAGLDPALIVLLALMVTGLSLRFRPLPASGIAVGIAAAYLVAAQVAFNHDRIVAVVYPLVAIAIAGVGSLVIQYVLEAFERQRTRDLFSRFVPDSVVDQVLARTDGDLRLGGVRLEGTVLFSDLRGFTSFAETLPAERVIEMLNRYLGEMSDAILGHGGTLVAYMGDGIMAVFGAPIETDDHADHALAAAREMLEVRLPRFNEWIKSEGYDEGFRMGIGLNSGPLMSGNVGHERRVEYTTIGDTTNTASRLEGMTKGTPHSMFVAESTRERLREQEGLFFVGEFEVRGKEKPINLWSIHERRPEEAQPQHEEVPDRLPALGAP
jgi:adenylate cyclase